MSSQNYDVCIRRAAGQCAICWAQSTTTAVGTAAGVGAIAGSFGLR